VFGLPCALQKYIALGQNPVGCLATAWKVIQKPW
jgi:hypothetical protein